MMARENRKLELLAPAGDWPALKAAVANGADAVYFGLARFNARARAANFAPDELPEVMEFLHGFNVRGYVAFNTLIFSDELPQAAAYASAIAQAGADAVIVQDLGLAELIHRLCPTMPIHASTQMALSEGLGIALARPLGLTRVILPRELSLEEIRAVADATDLELEAFAHGAMCISFSGRCLASQSLWNRSGNRGLCGQACRLPYQLIVDGQPVRDSRRFALSPRDLAAYDLVARLARSGVSGLKIEGRLKSEHYVAAACGVYRQAIDAAADGKEFRPSRRQELELAQSFSRGFTHGFLTGPDHQALVEGLSPKSRGLRLGKVLGLSGKGVVVQLSEGVEPPKPGDGVVFDRPGSARDEKDDPGGRIYSVAPAAGRKSGGSFLPLSLQGRGRPEGPGEGRLELTFDNALDLSAIAAGDDVRKTDDPEIRRGLDGTFARLNLHHPSPLRVGAELSPEGRLRLTFRDDGGNQAVVESDRPLAPATRAPLTISLLVEQLGRLGGTPFELGPVELRGAEGPCESIQVMAPKSVLNQLRRQGVAQLIARRRDRQRRPIAVAGALEILRSRAAQSRPAAPPAGAASLHVLVRTLAQASAMAGLRRNWPGAAMNAGLVYLDLADSAAVELALKICRDANAPAAMATPQVIKPMEERLLEAVAGRQTPAVLVRNLGSLAYMERHRPGAQLIGDAGLNVANELSAGFLVGRGLCRLTPAYDLSADDLRAMVGRSSAAWFEAVIYQRVPMFHMAHCVFARLSGASDCRGCSRPCLSHDLRLRDRNGVDHPVRVDAAGRNTVFRGEPESRIGQVAELTAMGVRDFRIELLDESPAESIRLVQAAVSCST